MTAVHWPHKCDSYWNQPHFPVKPDCGSKLPTELDDDDLWNSRNKRKKCLRRVQIFQSKEGKKIPPEVGVSLHLYQWTDGSLKFLWKYLVQQASGNWPRWRSAVQTN